MINLFLFLAIALGFTLFVGIILEKIRIPWIFAALIFGTLLAIKNPFNAITSSETFNFMAQLGMYFLLFLIGYELDIKMMKSKSRFLIRSTFLIISLEALFGTLIVHFIFGYNFIISILVAASFATVGEAILIPILDEFKITRTKLGQTILGIATLDDVIEISVLVLAVVLIGSKTSNSFSISLMFTLILIMITLTLMFIRFGKKIRKIKFLDENILFVFILSILFLFIGVGIYSELAPIGALLAGTIIKNILPRNLTSKADKKIKTICYGFFAPFFFLSVGASLNIGYLLKYPILILLVVVVSKSAKIIGSLIVGKKELGIKKSILLGIGLSVRFSTSIVLIKILYEGGLINNDIYSVIIASSIVFKFIVPVLFSNLLVKWKIARN